MARTAKKRKRKSAWKAPLPKGAQIQISLRARYLIHVLAAKEHRTPRGEVDVIVEEAFGRRKIDPAGYPSTAQGKQASPPVDSPAKGGRKDA